MRQRISENLENDNGKTNCRKCGHSLCASNENWKSAAILQQKPMNGAGGAPYQSSDHVLLRLFYCPGCKRQLGTETAVKEDPFLEDMLSDI